jgi:predicted O-methyltransferase YrrM
MTIQSTMTNDVIINLSKASIEKEDLKILLPVVQEIKPKNILEIGAWRGYSLEIWYQAFGPEKLMTIEHEKEALEFIKNRTRENEFAYMYPSPTLISLDSHDEKALSSITRELGSGKLDFLFIDGDHSYYGVQKDFNTYSPLVRKGGMIAFHDALYHADRTEEVDLFWRYKIRGKYPYLEIKAGKNSKGIGVIWV